MGISPAELLLIVSTLGALAFFGLPFAGIPRAVRRAGQRRRSIRAVVLASVGVGLGTIGLITSTLNLLFCLAMIALHGCWLAAAVWANKQVVKAAARQS